MKVDNIEVNGRTELGEPLRIVVDLFYREVLIHRPAVDGNRRQAIGAKAIQEMAFQVAYTTFEANEIMKTVWNLMDFEGKNIMEAGIPHISFGE